MKSNIQTRIIIAFSVLLLVIQITSMLMINTVFSSNKRKEVSDDLIRGERIFSLMLENNYRQLTQSSSIMSSDFAFRKSIALADKETILSVLANHSTRLSADMLLLTDLKGELISTTTALNNLADIDLRSLITNAELQGQTNTSAIVGDKLLQLVVVPVLGPLPMAWLVAGFQIDTPFVENLQSVTSTHITFVGKQAGDRGWQVLASSLPTELSQQLTVGGWLTYSNSQNNKIHSIPVNEDNYQTLIKKLRDNDGTTVLAVLQQSLNKALEPLKRLQIFLLLLGLASLAIVLLFSFLLARGISKPIIHLSKLADKIRQGDYSESVKVYREDEIGSLASAFNHMQDNIAEREARISDLAFQDQLTRLPNRVSFQAKLSELTVLAERLQEPAALLLINLDRMNEVNTILGHEIGDLLLQEVAKRLYSIRNTDSDIAARLGGDEFALLLFPCDGNCAIKITERVIQALDQPVLLKDQEILPTGSIGVALYPEHGRTASELLRRADIAMYRAKAELRNCVVFDPTFESSRKNLSLLAEMRHAISKGEFQLFYQPKLSLTDNEVTQFEALIRWNHPSQGQVPPNEFIPHAEQTGYIRQITLWVFEAALKQSVAWRMQQKALTISVNISARDLINIELPKLLQSLLNKHQAQASWLCLEITESAIITDARRSLSVLDTLKNMGFRLSIDDFGTGYSSLAYLKNLPVSELKIDQSFIFQISEHKNDRAIVETAINLGHSTGLAVVAEGVENQQALDILHCLGCDYAQGYYLAPPMPASKVISWLSLESWKKLLP